MGFRKLVDPEASDKSVDLAPDGILAGWHCRELEPVWGK